MINKAKTFGLRGALLGALLLTAATSPGAAVPAGQGTPPPEMSARGLLPLGAGGWLGVSIDEVAPDKAREMNLSDVYGVVITELGDNTPAAKAGLKPGDVITEYNGQRMEGRAQFRRMVRETPPGHVAHLTVWRGGHMQKMAVEVGQVPELNADNFESQIPAPPGFGFPAEPPGATRSRRNAGNTPTLGVAAQDISGQLGEYFGAPEGEGVLVTDVRAGSAGDKAGLRAGDVITKVDGQRVRNMGELREHLRDGRRVTLRVLRKGVETSLTAEPESPRTPGEFQPRNGMDRRIPL